MFEMNSQRARTFSRRLAGVIAEGQELHPAQPQQHSRCSRTTEGLERV